MSQKSNYDVIVIGGGITGAGIFYQSVFSGLDTLLLEAKDFSFGTSSRTGKLVHGGYRYLLNKQFGVSYHSVKEREKLIRKSRGLVNKIPFIYLMLDATNKTYAENSYSMFVYHLFANNLGYKKYSSAEIKESFGRFGLMSKLGGLGFSEGITDDSRLTLRLVFDSIRMGGEAKNYSKVVELLKDSNNRICGVTVKDQSSNRKDSEYEIFSDVVINATGIWMDDICRELGCERRIRKQRGSHIILPADKFPLNIGLMFNHPYDNRIQFALPWNERIIFGTTDLDEDHHVKYENVEPGISQEEIDYLLYSLNMTFPETNIETSDIISTYCGIRPIIYNSASHPSSSSRRHQIWDDNGMISIAGGKLTTFQIMANEALKKARKYLKKNIDKSARYSFLNQSYFINNRPDKSRQQYEAIYYRYGQRAMEFVENNDGKCLDQILSTPYMLADLKWAAKNEMVVHLDDLLLRRTRIGNFLKDGGMQVLRQFRSEIKRELSWSNKKWEDEMKRYKKIWVQSYSLPVYSCII